MKDDALRGAHPLNSGPPLWAAQLWLSLALKQQRHADHDWRITSLCTNGRFEGARTVGIGVPVPNTTARACLIPLMVAPRRPGDDRAAACAFAGRVRLRAWLGAAISAVGSVFAISISAI